MFLVFAFSTCQRCGKTADVDSILFNNGRMLCEKCNNLNVGGYCNSCHYFMKTKGVCYLNDKACSYKDKCMLSETSIALKEELLLSKRKKLRIYKVKEVTAGKASKASKSRK